MVFSEHPFKSGFKQHDVLAMWCSTFIEIREKIDEKAAKLKGIVPDHLLYLDNTVQGFDLGAGVFLHYCLSPFLLIPVEYLLPSSCITFWETELFWQADLLVCQLSSPWG